MQKLVFNSKTKKSMENFIENPSHALLIIGPEGSGKFSIAQYISEAVLNLSELQNYPYYLHLSSNDSNLSIETVRQIEQFLSLKVPGEKNYKRIIILEQAEQLVISAQNALLKNVEEPPSDTLIILTTSQLQAVLPTIRSRAQSIIIGRVNKADLRNLYPEIDTNEFSRIYAMSGGRPGLLQKLLQDSEHPFKQAALYTKDLLGKSIYERLLKVDELSRNIELAQNVTIMLQQMANISLQTAEGKSFERWKKVLIASNNANESLARHVQAKLVLTNLMLQL